MHLGFRLTQLKLCARKKWEVNVASTAKYRRVYKNVESHHLATKTTSMERDTLVYFTLLQLRYFTDTVVCVPVSV